MNKTTIANLALNHLGVSNTILDLDNDTSQEAKTLRLFYPFALQEILSTRRWGFATRYAPLALVSENPTNEWKYSYRYPSDCLYVRRILRNTGYIGNYNYKYYTADADIEYIIVGDATSQLIYTAEENAVIEYTKNIENLGTVPVLFTLALSYLLAHYAAPKLSKSDSYKLKKETLDFYKVKLGEAQVLDINQEKFKEEDPRSSIERARDGL